MENENYNIEMVVDLDEIFSNDENEAPVNDADFVIAESNSNLTENDTIPGVILDAATAAKNECLPEKSKARYFKALNAFEKWRLENSVNCITEDVLLGYFHQLSLKFKPTSLWSYYSMLKGTIKLRFGVEIARFTQLTTFLKKKSKGYKPVKAHVFTEQEMARFIVEANDREWLDVKAISIFGVCGALRSCEITNITVSDVERQGNLLLVRIKETKTKIDRSFTIPGAFCEIIERYAALRSPRTTTNRFFMNYMNGKCTVQPIGKNKISKTPSRIASFLSLQEPERYTGHALRRTGATIFINAGSSMESLKRFVTWRSTAVAESYVADSFYRQKKDGQTITSAILDSIPGSSSRNGHSIASISSVGAASTNDRSHEDTGTTSVDATQSVTLPPLHGIQTAEVISQTHTTLVRTTGTIQTNDDAQTVCANNNIIVESDSVVPSVQATDSLSEMSVNTHLANALPNGLFSFGSLSGCTFNVYLK